MFATPPPALSELREVIERSYAASDLMAARALILLKQSG
jgi:hypothetical protein